ncbi:MAG: D-amino acid dehydrogenase [Burkholderiales bacterium]
MKVLVLGAGVVGTAAAWYLAKAGHEVTVIERGTEPALETSYANGGQISVSHAEPWANPAAPIRVLKWLFKEDAPLLFRLRADLQQWTWGLRFLAECLPSRTRANIAQIVRLGVYSRARLKALRTETGIHYDHLERGILHFYTDRQAYKRALHPAELMRQCGCDRRVKTADECVAIEPALAAARARLAGGTYTAEDESGDARLFTVRLAELAGARGVAFKYRHAIEAIERAGDAVAAVRVRDGEGALRAIHADAYVVALGSYSPLLLRPLGIRIAVYPVKGYSATMPVVDTQKAPCVSLTDDEYQIVISRLGDRMRVAGTAELNGYNMELSEKRCRALVHRYESLFPGSVDTSAAQFWTGLRPATPGNVPLIGRAHYRNLYLNTGHGTLGWTHACGSGQAIADIVSGRKPEVDFRFLEV